MCPILIYEQRPAILLRCQMVCPDIVQVAPRRSVKASTGGHVTRFQVGLLATISLLALAPSAVLAGNLHNIDGEKTNLIQDAAVHGTPPHGTPSHGPGQVAGYACGGASATFVSGPGKSGYLLKNANHTYGCEGTPTGGGAGATYVGSSVAIQFTGLSFSLRNGKNGTVNVYLLTDQAPYPTYSVSFSNLVSADFTIAPGQFNPPVASGTQAVGVIFDANPCQQVTIKNVTVSGSPGVLQVHGATTCPQFVTCQPPN